MPRLVPTLLLAAAAILPASARAELAAGAGAAVDKAYADSQTRAALARRQNTMPRLSVPADKTVLDALWDTKLLGEPPYGAGDLPAISDILQKQVAVMRAYATFKPVENGLPHADNDHTFRPELLTAMNVIVQTDIVFLIAVDAVLPTLTPERIAPQRQALLQLRQAAASHALSATRIIDDDITPAQRETLAASLAVGGPAFAVSLTPQDRAALIAAAKSSALTTDPFVRRDLSQFMAALSITTCERLCALR